MGDEDDDWAATLYENLRVQYFEKFNGYVPGWEIVKALRKAKADGMRDAVLIFVDNPNSLLDATRRVVFKSIEIENGTKSDEYA